MFNKNKPVAIAIIFAFTLQSCATNTGIAVIDNTTSAMKETFNSDDPCSNSKRNLLLLIGATVGTVIGYRTAKNKSLGAVVGGATGGLILGLIGNELDKRACEISKIAKQNGLEIESAPIKAGVEVSPKNNPKAIKTEQVDVGYTYSIVDSQANSQFLTGSDKLQPSAQQYFKQLAEQYTVENVIKNSDTKDPKEIALLKKAAQEKRILLIGHTDDTGDTNYNAQLSEKRARTVARVFEAAGVRKEQLYYQGAGETMPIADNATEQGRSKNRRVEIVDLTDQVSFDLYLQNKRPNIEYYRPVVAKQNKSTPVVENNSKEAVQSKSKQQPEAKKEIKIVTNAPTKTTLNKEGFIDFGGEPLSNMRYVADIGDLKQKKSGFSLISEAKADDLSKIGTCELDRPRNRGLVKSLKTDKEYAIREFMPGLYGSSWHGYANRHLVALTNVTVLRDSLLPANKPQLVVFENYRKGNKDAKPNYREFPEVNVYQGDKALLYRVFGTGPVKCLDMVVPNDKPFNAPKSLIVYYNQSDLYAKSFSPNKL